MSAVHYGVPPAFLWVIMPLAVIYFAVVAVFFNWLKRTHPVTWNEIGQPSLFWNNSIRNNLLFLGFLVSTKYRAVNDRRLALWIWVIRLLFVAIIGLVIVAKSVPYP
jgi:hypothetical protein